MSNRDDFLGTPEAIAKAVATGGKTVRDRREKSSGASRKGGGSSGATGWERAASEENALIEAIDSKRDLALVAEIFREVKAGNKSLQTAFKEMSPAMAAKLLVIASRGENEKNRLDAIKTLLALGGHQPSQKHEISRVDPEAPKAALISMLRGSMKDLQAEGIEVVDDVSDEAEVK